MKNETPCIVKPFNTNVINRQNCTGNDETRKDLKKKSTSPMNMVRKCLLMNSEFITSGKTIRKQEQLYNPFEGKICCMEFWR